MILTNSLTPAQLLCLLILTSRSRASNDELQTPYGANQNARWRTLVCKTECDQYLVASDTVYNVRISISCRELRDVAVGDLNNSSVRLYTDFTRRGTDQHPQRHLCALLTYDAAKAAVVCPVFAQVAVESFAQLLRLVFTGTTRLVDFWLYANLPEAPPMSDLLAQNNAPTSGSLFCFGEPHTSDLPRHDAIYTFLSFLAMPFDLATSVINALLIRKILVSGGISVFSYHVGVLISNGCVYYFCLYITGGLGILHLMWYPACYIPGMTALAGHSLPLFANLANAIGEAAILSFFLVSSFLQTALAVDRALGLGFPIWYLKHVQSSYIWKTTLGLAILGFLTFAFRFGVVIEFHVRKLFYLLSFNPTALLKADDYQFNRYDDPLYRRAQGLQWVLLVASNTLQGLACIFVAYKIFARRKAQKLLLQKQKQQQAAQNASSHLLLGTCVINSVALVAMVFVSYNADDNAHFRALLSACCSCGFYVNCCCCGMYRRGLADFLRLNILIKAVYGKVSAIRQSNRVQPLQRDAENF